MKLTIALLSSSSRQGPYFLTNSPRQPLHPLHPLVSRWLDLPQVSNLLPFVREWIYSPWIPRIPTCMVVHALFLYFPFLGGFMGWFWGFCSRCFPRLWRVLERCFGSSFTWGKCLIRVFEHACKSSRFPWNSLVMIVQCFCTFLPLFLMF